MTEWKLTSINEVCARITSGGTPKTNRPEYYNGEIPWLKTQEVNFNRIYDTLTKITQLGLHESSAKIVEKDSVIVAMYGVTAGRVAINKIDLCTNQACCNLTPKRVICDHRFLYYYLLNNYIELVNLSTGAAQQNLNSQLISNFPFLLPPLPEQEAIAEVLSSLDDKIDLLHRNNKTLEEMAETLYRRLILTKDEFTEEVSLDTVFDFLEGPGIRNWQYKELGTRFINIRLIKDGEINVEDANCVSDEEANGKYAHFLLKERDMIVSTSGTLGKNAIIRSYHLPLMLNTSVIRFRPRNILYYSYMYQYLNSAEFQETLESLACGSVQANFGPSHLKTMKIGVPSNETLNSFIQFCDPLYEKLNHNYIQINLVKRLRDTLLPKLMSGAIRVKPFVNEFSEP